MPTWQLYSAAGNDFRWKISDEETKIEESSLALAAPQQLQSMADLLRQGRSKLAGSSDTSFTANFPVFRTGSGKPVAVKQSSISRALSILNDKNNVVRDTGQGIGRENSFAFQEAAFQKGSGKALNAPESFFLSGLEKQFNTSNSMFQTGSGKAVSISSAGLNRAKALLGLEENGDSETFQGSEKKNRSSDERFGFRSSVPFVAVEGIANTWSTKASAASLSPFDVKLNSSVCAAEELVPDFLHRADKPPPIKFHTAGGRSISVSSEALKRARSLLGDPELGCLVDEKDVVDPLFSFPKDHKYVDHSSIKELNSDTPVSLLSAAKGSGSSSLFTPPFGSTLYHKKSSVKTENLAPASNLMKEFDAVAKESTSRPDHSIPQHGEAFNKNSAAIDLRENDIPSKPKLLQRPSRGPLVNISNNIGAGSADRNQNFGQKRKPGRGSFVSPFKKPRIAKIVTPLKRNDSGASNAPQLPSQKGKASVRYPFHVARLYMKEYLGDPPSFQSKLENLPDEVRRMNPDIAETHVFNDKSCSGCIGVKSFWEMLSQSGASMQYVSKEWVTNHYKWIVWKLASYERCYSTKFSGKLLTICNVLEELKYRYEREVNYGHRSAIKRILEGDVPPSSMMVLCISKVYSICNSPVGPQFSLSDTTENGACAKIELTDGWYSITAVLDILLSKKLAAGKLFVGQKLRIWGARFCGWTGPVSPLEVSGTTSLLLHINGAYRAHWASRLGLCKGGAIPLSFLSIKDGGGSVPLTLVGISRIYPVLYRERLRNGGFVVRSERMEAKEMQSFNQRRCRVVEGITSESQRAKRDAYIGSDHESEEGARILKILERAAEPELLMAEMSKEQLNAFASYQAKLEASRQSDLQKSLEKALQAAGLAERDVTPFMRVRVVGLTSKSTPSKCCPQEGLITIWNPTEKQQSELAEGQAFAVTGLTPISSDSSTLYLQAKGSTAKWRPLSPMEIEGFEPFFCPRRSVPLSKLGEVPMSREFDIAAVVVFVGQLYTEAHQSKQWVFVADGSTSTCDSNDESETVMATSFTSPCVETDSFAPINSNLVGSVVSFCNLIKRARDNVNNLWVAEATENSTYYLNFDHSHCSHLKEASASAERWAKISGSRLEKLRGKVLSIISCR
ncbi:PREDICTED: protein BREAST CANCER SUSCEPTIBILITY 2 homolog B-like isoform X2 [Nicotiana attenuata]|uniref:protein BREAST CANCER SUSCEPTIBILITY 2 homolog B-like isoform X2 n=1 Tax=Nicotiana attenuata TaxID=49451 RepID=UPI000904A72E|nr:PREDICTED: protein BREAST CANCER SUSCEPTIBILITY 2 homolog B-like isoform X2 [Nicotiana attenuata]